MPTATYKIPVILDTDIGSDIDDAVCLAYLLRQPRCELLGITTVTGQPQQRAALADAVCAAAGRTDVPIHAGSDIGLGGRHFQPECPQSAILKDFAHRPADEFEQYTAIPFLLEQINSRPGEITLLAIGPMTNLGILFAADPTIPSKLKRLVLMCGVFSNTVECCVREWNASGDPLATDIVYRAAVSEHLSVGLDVTTKCHLPADEAISKFAQVGGPLAVVAAATQIWKNHSSRVTFHDPLAATLIFQPEICEYAEGTVFVETKSEKLSGVTLLENKRPGPHRIAWKVNPAAFFAEYFGIAGK